MLYATLKLLHVLSIIVWVGGMVFAHFFLRPAVQTLEPAKRIPLMHATLTRFFQAVLVASLIVLGTGVWMIGRIAKATVQSGVDFNMPLGWWVMTVTGVLMVAIFGHIRFALHGRLGRAVQVTDWAAGAAALASIRTWVGINIGLGVATVAAAILLS